jgi:hypothetical protein
MVRANVKTTRPPATRTPENLRKRKCVGKVGKEHKILSIPKLEHLRYDVKKSENEAAYEEP